MDTGKLSTTWAAIFCRPRILRRSLFLPAAVIIGVAIVFVATTAAPALVSKVNAPIGKHAAITPDDVDFFLSIDLQRASGNATADLRTAIRQHGQPQAIDNPVSHYTGLDWAETQASEWLGRELSVSINPDGHYAVIADVRDPQKAGDQLDQYLSNTPGDLHAALLDRHLIIASDPNAAEAVIALIDATQSNTLARTADYRLAQEQHHSKQPTAQLFLRWTLLDNRYARSHGALFGCDAQRWLSTAIDITTGQMAIQAHCPSIPGLRPPPELTPAQAHPRAREGQPAFRIASSFTPTADYIRLRTADTGHPQFTLLDLARSIILGPSAAQIDDIETSVLQHLDGYIRISIAEPNATFNAHLGINPDARHQLEDSVQSIASAAAAAYGIQVAQPTPGGWRIRHPYLPERPLTVLVNDSELSVTNAPHIPVLPAETTPSTTRSDTPMQTAAYANHYYTPKIIAALLPPAKGLAQAFDALRYSAHNDGNFLRHRLALRVKTDNLSRSWRPP